MEYLAKLLTNGSGYLDSVIALGSAAVAWLVVKLDWWKAQSRQVQVVAAIAVFLAVAFSLSLATSLMS